MSLTSYRAAPPRGGWRVDQRASLLGEVFCEWVLDVHGISRATGYNAWRRPTLPLLRQ